MKRLIIKLFCLMAILLTGCDGSETTSPLPTPASNSSLPAQTTSGSINANGILLPAREVNLSFGTGGKVETISVHVGDTIQKGQELARLESTLTMQGQAAEALQEIVASSREQEDYRSRLYYFYMPPSLRGLELLEALQQADEKLAGARLEYEPCKVLSPQRSECNEEDGDCKDKKGSACRNKQDNLETAQSNYNTILRRIEYEAALSSAEVRLKDAKEDYEKYRTGPANDPAYLEQMVITAPFEGTVSTIHLEQGEWADPGTAIIELQDVSRWRIETKNVGELQIGRVAIGQKVHARVNAFRDKTLNGRVVEIHPDAVVQQGDVTYTLIIELDATDLDLRAGMTVQVEIVTEE